MRLAYKHFPGAFCRRFVITSFIWRERQCLFGEDIMQLADSQKKCAFAFAAGFLITAMAFVFQAQIIPSIELQTLLGLYHLGDSALIANLFVANCLLIAILLAR